MSRVAVGLVAALVLVTAPARAGAEALKDDPRVATALEAQRAYEQIPGVSAAVVHDQEVLWSGGFGYADLARKAPAAADTIYSICSISKLFTAIAVMQQRDAGRLRLDDTVARHLPWFRIERTAPSGGEITIEGLLTHASGLPRESDQAYWTGPEFAFPAREQIVEGLKNQKSLYPAETFFQYSNLGLTLAGECAAAAAGEPYDAHVRRAILEPLGLTSTTPEIPRGERGKRLATGYSALGREGVRRPMPFFETRGIAPAAGFASTAADLARFAAWQLRLVGRGGNEVLAADTLREMQRVHWVDPDFETTWGLGFSVWRFDNKTLVGHGGSCPGYRTQLLLKPDERVAVVFMSNAVDAEAQQFANRMYEIVAPALKAASEPAAEKPKIADPALAPYLGTYAASFGGEVAVVRWEDGLALLGLPTRDPVRSMTRLRKTGDHVFRRVRKDEELGEEVAFELGPDGRAARFKRHSNYYSRIR